MTDIPQEITDPCSICYGDYTKTVRRPIECCHCAIRACNPCIKKHLISMPEDPHCPACRRFWNRAFLVDTLSRSWIEGEYKRHRQNVLFERERSLFPATQPAVELAVRKREAGKKITELGILLSDEVRKLHENTDRIKDAAVHQRQIVHAIEEEINTLSTFIKYGSLSGTAAPTPTTPCPANACRGFLHPITFTCAVCTSRFCRDCLERDTDAHTCNPATVATVRAILSDSRACPRCGISISRVSGCPQMFCTQCETAFDYNTGNIVRGVIHNPHYYEVRRRQISDQTAAATAACQNPDRIPGWYSDIHPLLLKHDRVTHVNFNYIRLLHQTLGHIYAGELPDLPHGPPTPADNEDLRVLYLLSEIDEKKFKQKLQQRDRQRQLRMEIRGPLELFVLLVGDYFREAVRTGTFAPFEPLHTQIETLVNAPLQDIACRYGNRTPRFEISEYYPVSFVARITFLPHGHRPDVYDKKAAEAAAIQAELNRHQYYRRRSFSLISETQAPPSGAGDHSTE